MCGASSRAIAAAMARARSGDPPTTPGGGNSYMFLHGHISCGARGSNPPIWPVTAGLTTPGPILIVQVAVNV